MPPLKNTFFADMRASLAKDLLEKSKKHKCASSLCKNLSNYVWITLTFRNDFHAIPVRTLFYRTVAWLYKRCWRIAKKDFSFVPEITEKGVLHYHLLINTTQYVRLAAFINCWKARYGNVDRETVYCILYLKHHYMRKQNAEMAKILKWPLHLMIFSGIRPRIFYRRLRTELLKRNAVKQSNIANKNLLDCITNWEKSLEEFAERHKKRVARA